MRPLNGYFTALSGREFNAFPRVLKLDSYRAFEAEHPVRDGGMKMPGRGLPSLKGKDANPHISGFKDHFIAIAHSFMPPLPPSAACQVGRHKFADSVHVTHLAAEVETDPLEHHPADMGNQAEHVLRRGSAQIEDEIGVLR